MGFFDDLSSSFQESVNKTQKESKYKKTISENKKKVEETYSEMGKMIYQKRNMDEELITYINSKVEAIDRMLKENEELNREILILNNKKICPNCGKEVELSTTFCPSCGAKQEEITTELFVPKGKRKCSGCGTIIDDKNVFCPNCGAKKEENYASEVINDKNEEEKVDPIVNSEENTNESKIEVENKKEILEQPISKEIEIDLTSGLEEEKSNVEEKSEPRICKNCGEILEEDDVFCANCGTKNEE